MLKKKILEVWWNLNYQWLSGKNTSLKLEMMVQVHLGSNKWKHINKAYDILICVCLFFYSIIFILYLFYGLFLS